VSAPIHRLRLQLNESMQETFLLPCVPTPVVSILRTRGTDMDLYPTTVTMSRQTKRRTTHAPDLRQRSGRPPSRTHLPIRLRTEYWTDDLPKAGPLSNGCGSEFSKLSSSETYPWFGASTFLRALGELGCKTMHRFHCYLIAGIVYYADHTDLTPLFD